MSEQAVEKHRYTVDVDAAENAGDGLVFTFVTKGLQQENGAPKRVRQFSVAVRQNGDALTFDWSNTPDDPGDARAEIEADIAVRMKDRATWIERVSNLVDQTEQWAREMGWSTRRVQKKLDDAWIGKHQVPALLMQQETCRVLLEPIGRSSPGADGVVDLYLMPAYDDIATLYFYSNRWNVHHNTYRGTNAVVPVSKAEAMPLSKETLEKVLVEMRRHAA
jgi:hypothetical protein